MDIGAVSVPEIAISVVAEFVRRRGELTERAIKSPPDEACAADARAQGKAGAVA